MLQQVNVVSKIAFVYLLFLRPLFKRLFWIQNGSGTIAVFFLAKLFDVCPFLVCTKAKVTQSIFIITSTFTGLISGVKIWVLLCFLIRSIPPGVKPFMVLLLFKIR